MRIRDWSSDVCSSDLIVGGRLGEPRRFRYGERGGIAALALRGALAAMEMRCGADLDGRVGERRPGRQRELGEQRVGDQRGRGCDMGGGVGHGLERSEEHTSDLQSLMRISYAVS